MADLSTILKDPNFVNANPATQQAIFDKWAPQDPNFANANLETQTAIRQKFGIPIAAPSAGIPGPRKTGTAVDQIPGYGGPVPAATEPAPAKSYTIGQKLAGAVEVIPALVTGAVTAPIVEASKIYGTLTSGKFGTQEGIRAGEETGRKMQANFYQPRTAAGQEYVGNIANAMTSTGLQGVPLNVLADLGAGLPAASRAVKDLGQAKVAQRAEKIAQQQSAADWARASQIEAAQAAQRLGVAVNPAETNPNVKTKLLVGATGEAVVNSKIAKANAPKWNDLARKDLGLPENTQLTPEAFDKARSAHSAPYDAIKQIGVMQPSEEVLNQLNSLKLDPRSTSSPEKAAKVNAAVDRVMTQAVDGLSGENVVSQIRDFRKDANQTFKNPNATGIEIDVAEANLGIADALENLIEGNIKDPKALDKFREARTAIAKTYDWERSTGITTKQVDPAQIVKLAEKGKPLTGVLADVANVAGNFPDIANLNLPKEPLLYQRLRRGGAGGTVGFALGGGPVGAAIGAGLTSLGSEATANMLARPGMQNRLAIPADRRIALPTEPVMPAAPIPQNRALTPYDYSQQTFTPPNFVMQPNQYGPRVVPGTPEAPRNALGYNPEPVGGGQAAALRMEDARLRALHQQRDLQAQAQAEAQAAATRQPTKGAIELQINPLTGVPEIATGIKGATPAIIESANKAAATAAEKMRLGRAFDMTAEEKIQWGKSLLEGMPIAQGDAIFGKLTPQQITAKMQDRAWVNNAITKARQEAQAFDEIAKRAADAQARSNAIATRERMLDLAEQMQDTLGARPVKRGGQGPKTRAHQRNMLRPEADDIQNALVK